MAKAKRRTGNAKQRKSAIDKISNATGPFLCLLDIAKEYANCPFATSTMMRSVQHFTAEVRVGIVECAKRLQEIGTDTEALVYLRHAEAILSSLDGFATDQREESLSGGTPMANKDIGNCLLALLHAVGEQADRACALEGNELNDLTGGCFMATTPPMANRKQLAAEAAHV